MRKVVQQRLKFPYTNDSLSWQIIELGTLLQKGTNTIRLTTIGGVTTQIDYIMVTDPAREPFIQASARNSSMVAGNTILSEASEISLYPNPAAEKVIAKLWAAGNEQIQLTIQI